MALLKPMLIFALALGLPLYAQVRSGGRPVHTVRARPRLRGGAPMQVMSGETLSFGFVPLQRGPKVMGALGSGVMDLGPVSYSSGASNSGVKVTRSRGSFTVKAPLGIKIGSAGTIAGTASLKAWLEIPAEPYQIYLDNVLLGPQPVPVESETPVGISHHDLEIVVPRSASGTKADFRATIAFEITEN